jgi:hypothetical protein
MADSMEGVVAEGEQPKGENVEQKAISGEYTAQHAFHLQVSLHQLHDIMACPQDVSESHDSNRHGVVQVSVPAR